MSSFKKRLVQVKQDMQDADLRTHAQRLALLETALQAALERIKALEEDSTSMGVSLYKEREKQRRGT